MKNKIRNIAFGLAAISSLPVSAAEPSAGKPNVILILIDDMGYPAIGCYGNKMVPTPNIDRLASEGVRFTQAYVTPQCTPTRASLLTGQYTIRNKMWHVIPKYGFPYARMKEPEYLDNLPRESFTIAEAMKEAGYATALIGKWHLSTFDHDGYYTYLYPDKAKYYGFDYLNPKTNPTEYQSHGDKGVDFLTNEAISFIDRNKNNPFFLYLAHHTVHNPVLAPRELTDKYLAKGYPEKGKDFAEYLASIEHLDNAVGRLLKNLKENDLEQNTMVIFVSDNGGVDAQFDNKPLRYGKGSAYEGGTRVPFIVRWPQTIEGERTCSVPIHIIDLYPTLLEASGTPNAKNHILDGQSILSLTRGDRKATKRMSSRPIYFYQPLYDIQWGAVPSAAVVKENYKLIWFFGDYIDLEQNGKYIPEGRVELYDLKKDIGETHDLSAQMPEIRNELLQNLTNWIVENNGVIPSLNPDFDLAKWDQRKNEKREE